MGKILLRSACRCVVLCDRSRRICAVPEGRRGDQIGGQRLRLSGGGYAGLSRRLLNGDAEKAISSFAIETFTAHFDWKTYAERRSMYLPNSYSPDWFGAEQVNLAVRFRDAAGALYTQYRPDRFGGHPL